MTIKELVNTKEQLNLTEESFLQLEKNWLGLKMTLDPCSFLNSSQASGFTGTDLEETLKEESKSNALRVLRRKGYNRETEIEEISGDEKISSSSDERTSSPTTSLRIQSMAHATLLEIDKKSANKSKLVNKCLSGKPKPRSGSASTLPKNLNKQSLRNKPTWKRPLILRSPCPATSDLESKFSEFMKSLISFESAKKVDFRYHKSLFTRQVASIIKRANAWE